ncbi:MAG: 50S ribosomal protein L1 [Polaromonas sp.]|uniref:50S ribosomal protein L1 n=1 Tax=Polaromonas sp. TaxID=1869339 RepID=UPI004036E5BA
MSKLTKRQKTIGDKIDSNKLYPVADALGLVKEFAVAKFDESIDVAVQLGIDAKKSDQVVRGAVVLPNGTGKTKRVAVFAQGAKAEEAKAAGADIVGMDDLAADIKAGIVHGTIGRRSFDNDKLQGNLAALIDALTKAKPASSKGVYLRKVAVSSTMGVGVRVDTQTISA